MNAFDAVEQFEEALCEYTGAPFAITTTRCTIAIWACLEYYRRYFVARPPVISLPRRTYRGVPQAVVRSDHLVGFDDRSWTGGYRLDPYPVWDYARRFTTGMYRPGEYQCLSFHTSKILGHTQGGAVLCDSNHAAQWLRAAFRDGQPRAGGPIGDMIGFFAYMGPDVAGALHWKLGHLPKSNADLPNSDYPDLSLTDWNRLYER